MLDNITVIILTFNEEQNIGVVLDSLEGVTKNIFVVDSYSTDGTVDILKKRGIVYEKRKFITYSNQRNWAQRKSPFNTEWVLHLDADEPISQELAEWLKNLNEESVSRVNGFMFSRRTIFMGKWIRHGGQYPNFHLRLFKKSHGHCEDKDYDQHFVVEGTVKKVPKVDIINTVASNLDDFVLSHNRWSNLEARETLKGVEKGDVTPSVLGNPIERRRWLKVNVFERSPRLVRAFIYFLYRYFIRLGFLDGKEGLIFLTLQTLWFRFLVDAKIYELSQRENNKNKSYGGGSVS